MMTVPPALAVSFFITVFITGIFTVGFSGLDHAAGIAGAALVVLGGGSVITLLWRHG